MSEADKAAEVAVAVSAEQSRQASTANADGKVEADGMDDLLAAIKGELARQADVKASLEQRAITVITTSGALATIVFTVVAAITKINSAKDFVKPEHTLIQIGVGAFLVAAAIALLVNFPRRYGAIDPDSVSEIVDYVRTYRRATNTHLGVVEKLVKYGLEELKTWQNKNWMKAVILEFAFLFEIVAVGFIFVALVVILAKI